MIILPFGLRSLFGIIPTVGPHMTIFSASLDVILVILIVVFAIAKALFLSPLRPCSVSLWRRPSSRPPACYAW